MIAPYEKIKDRIRHHGDPKEIENLCLDDIRIVHFTCEINMQFFNCSKLKYLTMNQCRIISLVGFPQINHITCLEMQNNSIKSSDLKYIQQCTQLSHLSLDGNQIQTLDQFEELSSLENLEHIEIFQNPACNIQDYRNIIFRFIPQLQIVDCRDKNGNDDVIYESIDETESNLDDIEFGDQDLDSSLSQGEINSNEESDELKTESKNQRPPTKYRRM